MTKKYTRISSVLGIGKYILAIIVCAMIPRVTTAQSPITAATASTQSMTEQVESPRRILSEDKKAYTASNGAVYQVGETLTLNVGTGPQGIFRFTNWYALGLPIGTRHLIAIYGAQEHVITEFKQEKNGPKRVYAIIECSKAKFAVFIENSIASKEMQ